MASITDFPGNPVAIYRKKREQVRQVLPLTGKQPANDQEETTKRINEVLTMLNNRYKIVNTVKYRHREYRYWKKAPAYPETLKKALRTNG